VAVYDPHPLLAISSVATAPSPATSGTSLVVASGEGTRFGSTFSFNATVCPDTLTIARAQEGSSARTIVAGDLIFASVTPKVVTDLETNTEYAFSTWKPLDGWRSALNFALASGAAQLTDLLVYPNSTVALAAAGSAVAVQKLDPARLPGGTGRTLKVQVEFIAFTNAVAPGITFTLALKPVATWSRASGSDPAVATVGAAVATATLTTPAANGDGLSATGEADFPAAGSYVLSFSTSGANAANAALRWGWRVYYRHV
jgi:hypothetical protein